MNQNYLAFFRNVYYKSERKLNLIIDGKNMTFDLNNEKLVSEKIMLGKLEQQWKI